MTESSTQLAKRRLEELVSFFGINADVEVKETEAGIELELATEASGRLIGYHGESLRAIQYVINLMVQKTGEQRRVFVDIGGYKKARAYLLEKQAREVAQKVIESGEEVAMEPMNAAERRIVHLALKEFENLSTDSRGQEPKRYIVVLPQVAVDGQS